MGLCQIEDICITPNLRQIGQHSRLSIKRQIVIARDKLGQTDIGPVLASLETMLRQVGMLAIGAA